ncbi:MAG: sirohydrochlorin chelatase [Pseudomonadota bacterium]
MAPAIESPLRNAHGSAALILAHGAPAAPDGGQGKVHALARACEKALGKGWTVAGASLAADGALGQALAALPASAPLWVYPFLMAKGWFARVEIPRCLSAAGASAYTMLPPFGLEPALHRLCGQRAGDAAATAGHAPGATTLILAAHGAAQDPHACRSARLAAGYLRASKKFRAVVVGFVEGTPSLADAVRVDGPALCLPFFASRAGHVARDLPRALAKGGFAGVLLPPIGADREAPRIIARTLARAQGPSLQGGHGW